jgi:hypothetical protein
MLFAEGRTLMADRTVANRVRRYREAQKAEREICRVEVQVPSIAIDDIKALGGRLQKAFKKAAAAETQIRFILKTINAPRPYPIDAKVFVHCLTTDQPDRKWRAHIEAFFDEVSVEAIHDLVLAGVVSFEDLYRAARNWRVTNGRSVGWIKEMADLRLAKLVA